VSLHRLLFSIALPGSLDAWGVLGNVAIPNLNAFQKLLFVSAHNRPRRIKPNDAEILKQKKIGKKAP